MKMDVFFVELGAAIPLSAITEIYVNTRSGYTIVILRTAGEKQNLTFDLKGSFTRSEVLRVISDYSYCTGFLEVAADSFRATLMANKGLTEPETDSPDL